MKAGDAIARNEVLLIPVPEAARLLGIGQMLLSSLGEPFDCTGTVVQEHLELSSAMA